MEFRVGDHTFDAHAPLVVGVVRGRPDPAALRDSVGEGALIVEVDDDDAVRLARADGHTGPLATTAELDSCPLPSVVTDDPAVLAVAVVDGARLLRTRRPGPARRVAGALGAVLTARVGLGLPPDPTPVTPGEPVRRG